MSDQAPYQRIKESLLQRVKSGDWRPGDTIPGELQLADDFSCARATVHRALRELADEGIFERRRKAGTRVAVPTGRSVALDIPLVDQEIRATGAEYGYRLLARALEQLPPVAAESLDRAPGEQALHLTCLHYADRRPFQVEDRWIDPGTVPEALDAPFDEEGPNAWLLRNVPWTDAEHAIFASAADKDVAAALSIPSSSPVLAVERRTWNQKGPVTFVRFFYPGESYRLRTSFAAR